MNIIWNLLRKSGLPGKHNGQAEIVMGMFAFLMVLVFMLAGLKVSQFMITGAYVEDALAASNLASALIDVEKYGKTKVIYISDTQAAFETYREALAINLQLDSEGNSFQKDLLQGPVSILSYVVYNVEDGLVDICCITEDGRQEHTQGITGEVYTPDGVQVETTTIYSQVQFGVRGIGQQPVRAVKEKSVDIKRDEVEQSG